jgi:uncharacterized protein (DUF302 family)
MNKKLISGLILGIILGFGLVFFGASSAMINEDVSKYSFEETVEKVTRTAADKGWKIPTIHHLNKSVAMAGYNVLPAAVIELCHPAHAGKILSNDDDKVVTSMMPCRVSIYENEKGEVIVSRMNSGLISKLFGGNIADVMAVAANDTEIILESVL